jgi:Cys-tRNA(Pro)/Cys-tRNA(Cys) deacylase
MNKTNSMRMLDTEKVSYEVHTFSEKIHSALGVSEVTGIPAQRVYKTLVAMSGQGEPILAIVPGDCTLSLKRLGTAVGDKRVRMATKAEAEKVTGLKTGGISALALVHRNFAVVMDESALSFDRVLVSAGCRGVNLGLDPTDLADVTGAVIAGISQPGEGD